MESKSEQGLSQSARKGVGLFNLLLVVALIAIVAAVLFDKAQFVREEARLAMFKNYASLFQAAVRMVHGKWYMKGQPQGTKTVLMENGKVVGVTPAGWPVNGVFGKSEGSAQGCVEVWNSVLANSSAMAALTNRDMFTASYKQHVCTYTLNAEPGFRITYNISTGSVATVTDLFLL